MQYKYERLLFDDEELDWSGPGWYECRGQYSSETGFSWNRWIQSEHGENRIYLSDPTDLMMPQEDIKYERSDSRHNPA